MIYFDNAATTKASEGAAGAALEMMTQKFGNPSSLHALGLSAEKAVTESAAAMASMLRCQPDEIIFTSGGTESNNLAIQGAARANSRRGRHILTSAAEHPSVISACKSLEGEGFEVEYVSPGQSGRVDPAHAGGLARGDTVLASFMHVNNETGAVSDIDAIAAAIKAANPQTLVHSDGVQAFCKETVNLRNLDMYSASAHKFHGIKGAGFLYIRCGTKIRRILHGGGRQEDYRPGTENAPGIVSMAAAAKEQTDAKRGSLETVVRVKEILIQLCNDLEGVYVNGNLPCEGANPPDSPFILNMSFLGVNAEVLVNALSEEGVCVSTGAACSGRQRKHNPLKETGLPKERYESAVRFSFSYENTEEEAVSVRKTVERLVNEIRFVSKIW